MTRQIAWLFLLCMGAVEIRAQDLQNIQIHGFATQGFVFSSNNNYLTMNSSSGSLQWTEGAISVSDAVSDNLRVGIQLHVYQMGQIGGPNVLVDWALGDYKVNDHLGFRAGKVKVPIGLFNDSQDVDSLFLWILLPQAMYPVDNRDYDLAVLGGQVYGSLNLGERSGRVVYAGYVGQQNLDANGGYVLQLEAAGLTFPSPPSGKAFGGDLRWATPWHGFTFGASAYDYTLNGTGPQGSFDLAPELVTAYYAQWQTGKLQLAAEYWRVPYSYIVTIGSTAIPFPGDSRSWYPMVIYHLTKKLQTGSYYSSYVNKAADTSQPVNYSKDWVVSGRYDFNNYFYGKLEGHFLHGTGLGYYESVNPNGLKTNSNMLAARIGFTF